MKPSDSGASIYTRDLLPQNVGYPHKNKFNHIWTSKPKLCTDLQHPVNRLFSCYSYCFIHSDFRQLMFHAEIKFFQCVEFHMRTIVAGAAIGWRCRDECFLW